METQTDTSKAIDELFDEIKKLEHELADTKDRLNKERSWVMTLLDQLMHYKAQEAYLLTAFKQLLNRSVKIMSLREDAPLHFDIQCYALASEIHEYLISIYNKNTNTFNLRGE